MGSEIEAAAQATQAVAEAKGKAIDASRDEGGFFGRIFGPGLEEWGELTIHQFDLLSLTA